MHIEWQWQPVAINNYIEIIERIAAEKEAGLYFPIVLNICDGDEINGAPGISVVKLLESKRLIFTGAIHFFITSQLLKYPQKGPLIMRMYQLPHGKPFIKRIKILKVFLNGLAAPSYSTPVSGGSMGLGIKNVVDTKATRQEQIDKMFSGYRGWNLASDGLIAEAFVAGEEYTTLIVGAYNNPSAATIYLPVERLFHASLLDEHMEPFKCSCGTAGCRVLISEIANNSVTEREIKRGKKI